MRSPWWIVGLGALLLLALLYGLEVVGPSSSNSYDEESPPGGASVGDVTLAGASRRVGASEEASSADGPEPPDIASEVRGSRPGGARLEGRVVLGPERVPAPGVRVLLLRPAPIAHWLGVPTQGRADLLEARSAQDGSFAFSEVIPGRGYRVRAHGATAASTSTGFDLFTGETRTLGDIVLGPGHVLTGRIVDHEGAAVAGADVLVTWHIDSELQIVLTDLEGVPETESRTQTGADGRFRFEGLEAGDKTLLARAPKGAEGGLASLEVGGDAPTDVGDIPLPGPGLLAGHVLWSDGSPIAGARAFAAPRFKPLVRSVTTGPDGAFRFEWLEPGENLVLGVLVTGMPVHIEQEVEIGREDLRIEFALPGSIRGRAVGAAGGRPIARLDVDARLTRFEHPMLGFVMATVYSALGTSPFESADGTFLLAPLAPGTYSVRVHAPGHAAGLVSPVVVESGKTTDLRVELGSGATAAGTVERASGLPLAGARLFLFPDGRIEDDASTSELAEAAGARMPDGTSDEEGAFLLPMQTPGRYDLVATHEDSQPGVLRDLDLRGEGLTGLRVRLEPAGRIEVSVRAADGGPAPGETVWVLFADGRRVDEETDAQGNCRFAQLPTGRCIVRIPSAAHGVTLVEAFYMGDTEQGRVRFEQLAAAGGEHFVSDGRVLKLSLEAPRRAKVTLRLMQRGRPFVDARGGFVRAADGSTWDWVEAKSGVLTFELEPGRHRLYVWGLSDQATLLDLDIPDVSLHEQELDVPPPTEER